jgi:integrase
MHIPLHLDKPIDIAPFIIHINPSINVFRQQYVIKECRMKGSRPLSDDEVARVGKSFKGLYAKRNKALFVLGVRTGFRISELLDLRVKDTWRHERVVDHLTVHRSAMKGGKAAESKPRPAGHPDLCFCKDCQIARGERKPPAPKADSRTVKLHPEARAALQVWLEQLARRLGGLDPELPVFVGRTERRHPKTGERIGISRIQAWRLLHEAYEANQLEGKLGTHAMRKTFANRMYEKLGHDLVKTQRALSHKNINSTVAYLSFREEEIDAAMIA